MDQNKLLAEWIQLAVLTTNPHEAKVRCHSGCGYKLKKNSDRINGLAGEKLDGSTQAGHGFCEKCDENRLIASVTMAA